MNKSAVDNILCTICARGGSKGVKNKNIRPLFGKPLIAYSIELAQKWGKASRVIVSTDSETIAETARKYGADVPFMRPANLAGDNAAKIPSIRHALIESEKFFNEKYDIILDLDASAPIRKTEDLDNCLNTFIEQRPKSLVSVVHARRNPYFNMLERKKDNGFFKLCKKLPGSVVARQHAPEVYSMNASIYFYDRDFILDETSTTPLSDRTAVYVMDELSGWDIDTEADFKFIEYLIKEDLWHVEV